jgi:hypothetical protein
MGEIFQKKKLPDIGSFSIFLFIFLLDCYPFGYCRAIREFYLNEIKTGS